MNQHTGGEGASAVEFALLLPVLVVLIFGILFGGLLLNQQLSVTQAAREGARYGATLPVQDVTPTTEWFEMVRERAVRGSAGALTAADEVICVWFIADDGTEIADPDNALDCPGSPPGELPSDDEGNRVVVYAEQPAVLQLALYSFDTTLTARAVARHEGGLPEG